MMPGIPTIFMLAGISLLALSDEQEEKKLCPYLQIVYAKGSVADPQVDEKHQELAQLGCVRHYGEGACLAKFTKLGDRNYRAICRRGESYGK